MARRWLLAFAGLLAAAAASPQSPNAPPPRAKTADAEFVETIAADLLADVELARLAAQKATRPEVRDLGGALLAEGERTLADLRALAAQKQFVLPTEPRRDRVAVIAELDALTGAAFDESYLLEVASARDRALPLFTRAAGSWGDPDVKAWADRSLPALREQLAKARRLSEPAITTNAPPR